MSAEDSPPVDVSVLVPVLNESAGIVETVRAMRAQRFDGTIEFLFADGRSEDDTRQQLEQMTLTDPRIRVLDNPLRGTASGLNVCLREARGEYVARMDAHTLYPPCYLQAGVERLRAGDVDWVAGPQVAQPHGPVSAAVAAALTTRLGRGGSKRWSGAGEQGEQELDTGVFCGVWRRADVLAHGGWDEDWPRNQDSELAARFISHGQRIVSLPSMAAAYTPRDSILALWRQYRGYGQYRARTALRHPESLRRSAVLPPLLVLCGAAAVIAPAPLRRLARIGAAVYGVALAGAAVQTARGRRGPAALVPIALATMHTAHGVGFLEGSKRWGVPWRALARVARGASDPILPYAGPVQAPSLQRPAVNASIADPDAWRRRAAGT
jgi:glycosyltransferase involved in cell wall biosynthesis